MADISKCTYENCEKAKTCFRILAQDSPWQSWSDFSTYCKEGNYCFYWPIDYDENYEVDNA